MWSLSRATTNQTQHCERRATLLVHTAIDRFTGQVIDKQIEVVNE